MNAIGCCTTLVGCAYTIRAIERRGELRGLVRRALAVLAALVLYFLVSFLVPRAANISAPLIWVAQQSSAVKVSVSLLFPLVSTPFVAVARSFGATVGGNLMNGLFPLTFLFSLIMGLIQRFVVGSLPTLSGVAGTVAAQAAVEVVMRQTLPLQRRCWLRFVKRRTVDDVDRELKSSEFKDKCAAVILARATAEHAGKSRPLR